MAGVGYKNEKHVRSALESTHIAVLVAYIQPTNLKDSYAVFGF